MQFRLAIVLLGFAVLAFTSYNIFHIAEEFQARAKHNSSLVADSVVPSLIFLDQKSALATLGILAQDKTLVAARIENSQSERFAEIGQEGLLDQIHLGFQVDSFKFRGLYTYSSDLVDKGTVVGRLIVSYNTNQVISTMISSIFIAFLIMVAGFFTAYFLNRYMERVLVAPILNLQGAMRTISKSNQYSMRIDQKLAGSTLEMGEMAEAFNEMLSQIEHRDQLLGSVNDQLEQKVFDRTQELLETQKALVQSAKMSALGELSAGIAHEINNPLAVIMALSGKVSRRLKKENPNLPEAVVDLQKIEIMTDRIAKTIRGLRTFARDGQGDPFEEYSVNAILDDALELSAERLKNHGIELRVKKLEGDARLTCRATQLSQILVNLINNSRDAIEYLETKWVELGVEMNEAEVVFSVTDSGGGLPPGVAEKIMTPFFTTKPVGKGTGLGLSISKGIVEAHHGRFFVDSACKNTRFVIVIPRNITAGQSAA